MLILLQNGQILTFLINEKSCFFNFFSAKIFSSEEKSNSSNISSEIFKFSFLVFEFFFRKKIENQQRNFSSEKNWTNIRIILRFLNKTFWLFVIVIEKAREISRTVSMKFHGLQIFYENTFLFFGQEALGPTRPPTVWLDF